MSTFACHPSMGSEAGVGWAWLKEMSKYNNVWALVWDGQGQIDALKKAIEIDKIKSVTIVPIYVPDLLHEHFRKFAYALWNIKALMVAKKLHKKINFDIIHKTTIAAWWDVGYLYKLNIPYIWGPISGAQRIPLSMFGFISIKERVKEIIRSILLEIGWNFRSNFRKAARSANYVFAANPETENKLKAFLRKVKVVALNEVGSFKCSNKIETEHETVELLWCGNSEYRKNFGLCVEALRNVSTKIPWHLTVVGGGARLEAYKNYVQHLGIASKISFVGKIPYNEMGDLYSKADIFLFTSLREATGTVLIEAMSYGVVPISLEIHGARIVIDKQCGMLIPAQDKDETIQKYTEAIKFLIENKEVRNEMARNAIKRIEENFLWDKRGILMHSFYQKVLNCQ